MADKRKLVIVGNGMAAGRLVDEILAKKANGFEITVIGEEPQGSYNRILLSSVLAGDAPESQVIQKDALWFAEAGIVFLGGCRVTRIDALNKTLSLHDGTLIGYDELVISTGSSPSSIPAKGQHLDNILHFRNLDDVRKMSDLAERGGNAVVIGGGFLGLEAAYGLACKGMPVTLVHRSNHLLSRQLDARAAQYLKALMEGKNITFALGTEVQSFNGVSQLESVTLTNGKTIDCTTAVIATGIQANTEVARGSGIEVGRGIVVDEYLQTNQPHVSALGECCEFAGTTFGLVEPIWDQCVVLAARLAGASSRPFSLRPIATKLKVSGVQLYSAGDYLTDPAHREIVLDDPANGIYRKLLVKNNCIVGVVLFGNTQDGNFYFDLMQNKTDISTMMPMLIFGRNYCDAPDPSQQNTAAEVA